MHRSRASSNVCSPKDSIVKVVVDDNYDDKLGKKLVMPPEEESKGSFASMTSENYVEQEVVVEIIPNDSSAQNEQSSSVINADNYSPCRVPPDVQRKQINCSQPTFMQLQSPMKQIQVAGSASKEVDDEQGGSSSAQSGAETNYRVIEEVSRFQEETIDSANYNGDPALDENDYTEPTARETMAELHVTEFKVIN